MSENRSGAAWTNAAHILLAGLLIVAAGFVYRQGTYAYSLLRFPYEWDEDEGFVIYAAQRILKGQTIYGDLNRLPMMSSIYPPVHPAAIAPLVAGFGATLLAGRIVSVVAMVGLCVLVGLAVAQETKRWYFGVAAACTTLGPSAIAMFGPLARADSLMMLLVMAGLLLVRQYPRSHVALVTGLLALLLACYTKYQAAFLVPAAFWYLWRRNRRVTLLSIAGFGAAGFVALAFLMRWSKGWFWYNTVTVVATEWILDYFLPRVQGFIWQHAIVLAGTAGWLVYQLRRRDMDLWGALAIASISILAFMGKAGASSNYFIPSAVAMIICTSLAADRLLRDLPPAWRHGGPHVLMITLLLQGIGWSAPINMPTDEDRQNGDRILQRVLATKGDVLTERRIMFSILAGREPQIDMCLLVFVRERDVKLGTRLWDPTEIIQAVMEKRYPLIVVVPELVPREIWDAISANYRALDEPAVRMGNWHGQNAYILFVPDAGATSPGR